MKCKKCTITLILFLVVAAAAVFFVVRQARAEALSVVINEVAWMGTEIGDNSRRWWRYEWLELYNNTDDTISVDGWRIELWRASKDFEISLEGTIAPHSYYLIIASEEMLKDKRFENYDINYGNLGGKLNNDGQNVYLYDANDNLIDEIDAHAHGTWPTGNNDTKATMEKKDPTKAGTVESSWANGPEGGTPAEKNLNFTQNNQDTSNNNQAESEDTNNKSTSTEVEEEVQVDTGKEETTPQEDQTEESTSTQSTTQNEDEESDPALASYTENVRVNEFIPNPEGKDAQNEWIELHNTGEEAYDLSGWQLDDEPEGSSPFTIGENTTITPGQYLVFSIRTTGIQLNNGGDEVRLLFPNENVAHSVQYTESTEGESIAFVSGEWVSTDRPTPGSANMGPSPQKTEESSDAASKKTTINETTATEEDRTPRTATSATGFAAGISSSTPSRAVPFIIAGVIALAGGGGFLLLKKKFLSE